MKRGSNQHQVKWKGLKKTTWKTIILIFFLLALPLYGLRQARVAQVDKERNPKIVYAVIEPTPIPYKEPELASLRDQEKAIAIIKKTWRKDWKTGVILARCESGLREDIIGKMTHDIGYFQINPIHGFTDEQMQNGVANSSFAYVIYQEQYLEPWESSRECWEGKI